MRLTLTMTVTAIGSFVFGLAYLLFPKTFLSYYGISLDETALWTARYLGAAILGFGVINWLGRNIGSGSALRAIITGTFLTALIGFIVSLFESLNGSGNGLIWVNTTIWFLLAIGHGDFVFRTPPSK